MIEFKNLSSVELVGLTVFYFILFLYHLIIYIIKSCNLFFFILFDGVLPFKKQ